MVGSVGGNKPYQINVREETGSQTQAYAKVSQKHVNTDNFVDVSDGNIKLADISGALKSAEKSNQYEFKDTIYLEDKNNKILKIDLSESKAIVEQMIADLKSGKTIKLADIDLNVLKTDRDVDLDFKYRPQNMDFMKDIPKYQDMALKITQDWFSFEQEALKDGVSLSDSERLNMAAHTMNKEGVPPYLQKEIIGGLFYGQVESRYHADNINMISIDSKTDTVNVSFRVSAEFGDTKDIKAQSFEPPKAYAGKDDNMRQRLVNNIRNGVFNQMNIKGETYSVPVSDEESFLYERADAILNSFLETEEGKPFKQMSPEERVSSKDFQIGINMHRLDRQEEYKNWSKTVLERTLQESIIDPNIPNHELTLSALSIVQGVKNPNYDMVKHNVMYLEDEAVVAEFMEKHRGVEVNFNPAAKNSSAPDFLSIEGKGFIPKPKLQGNKSVSDLSKTKQQTSSEANDIKKETQMPKIIRTTVDEPDIEIKKSTTKGRGKNGSKRKIEQTLKMKI